VVLLVWSIITERHVKRGGVNASIGRLLALYALAIVVYFIVTRETFGSFTGPTFSTYAPSLGALPNRLIMQLYDVRQGLLAYSPLYALALAGLFSGTIHRNRLCTYSLALLTIYIGTFIWSTAAESWTARYWVAAIPFLAVGLVFWMRRASHWVHWLPALPCIVLSVINSALFCEQPAWFLENRRASITYAVLFKLSHVHLGLFLPIDADPGALPSFSAATPLLLMFTGALLGLLTLCTLGARWRTVGSVGALLLVLLPFVAGTQRVLASANYRLSTNNGKGTFTIVMAGSPRNLSAVQLDGLLPFIWDSRDYPKYFSVRCYLRNGRVSSSIQPSRAVILLPNCRATTKVEVGVFPRSPVNNVLDRVGPITVMQPIAR